MRRKCTNCIHHIVCFKNDLILDTLHGGVPCEDFDHVDNYKVVKYSCTDGEEQSNG